MPGTTRISPFDTGIEGEPLKKERTRSTFWMIRLRWLAGAAIVVGTVAAALLGIVTEAAQLLTIGAAVLGYNAVVWLAVRPGKVRALGSSQTFWLAQIAADMAALTGIVYFCGGIDSPLALFYVFHIVCAGILLTPRLAYVVAGVATVFFSAVVLLQAAVPSLYHPLAILAPGQHHRIWLYVGLGLCAFAAAMFASTYLAVTIAKRVRATEQQVVRQRDVLDSIIASMSESLAFLTPGGTPVVWNSAGGRWLLGGSPGRGGDAPAGAEMPEAVREYVRRASQASTPLPAETFWVEVPAEADEAARQFRACASSVLDDDGRHIGYVIVAEDLTEQLRLEQDLREQNRQTRAMSQALRKNQDEMAQREKMVAIGTMAAGVAHEIGNPLACLSAIVQMLRRQGPSEDSDKHLRVIEEQIQRIVRIVRELLTFARPGACERVLADMDELVEQMVRMVGYSHRSRHVRIESVRKDGLPKVRVAPQLFQQALINLLINALDAVKGLGGNPLVTVERAANDGWVSVRVIDRGVGMSQEQIRKAFEPFYTTKGPGEGTGLGLSVSYRLIEQQGGRIEIESSPGEGTVATVLLPAAQPTPQAAG